MRNIKHIDDLTPEEEDELFFARKKTITAFVPLTEPCVILTKEGDGYRIDDWQKYFLAIDTEDGSVWPVAVEFFSRNYIEMDLADQIAMKYDLDKRKEQV